MACEPPRATRIAFEGDMLVAELGDGREIRGPLEWFPRLRDAPPERRADYRLVGRGVGVHWPDVDEDLSAAGLLAGRPSIEFIKHQRRARASKVAA